MKNMDLHIKTEELCEILSRVSNDMPIFASLLSEELDHLVEMARTMESGICIFNNSQEISRPLELLYGLIHLNKVYILCNSTSNTILLIDHFIGPLFSRLKQNDSSCKLSVQVTFVIEDIIKFTIQSRLIRAAKELSSVGAEINLLEIQEPNSQSFFESIIFFAQSQPFCAIVPEMNESGGYSRFELTTKSYQLKSLITTLETILKKGTILEMSMI
jgi:hypothetical protein